MIVVMSAFSIVKSSWKFSYLIPKKSKPRFNIFYPITLKKEHYYLFCKIRLANLFLGVEMNVDFNKCIIRYIVLAY